MAKEKASILILDDDKDVLISARLLLKQHFTDVQTTFNPRDLNTLLSQNDFDVVLLDMNFKIGKNDGKEGIYWLKHILSIRPNIKIIALTAYGDVELAVNALKLGATDFILKPWNNEKLVANVKTAFSLSQSEKKLEKTTSINKSLTAQIERDFDTIIGNSNAIKSTLKTIEKIAPTDASVLILGENGTGKQVIARAIHKNSLRNDKPFIHVDLGSLSENIFESELFGYAKGAFTDAKENKAGRFELADGGTIFLDEIGNLTYKLQSKLLTVLQNQTVIRLGESKERKINVRVICATNSNLTEMIQEKEFREDLMYRINTVELQLPPLRQRDGDIELLVNHFLAQFNKKYRKNIVVESDAMQKLSAYSWPGNIRELMHNVERLVILAEGNSIQESDIQLTNSGKKSDTSSLDGLSLEEMEKLMIEKAIQQHSGNISKAAKELGLTRASLYRRMEKYDL